MHTNAMQMYCHVTYVRMHSNLYILRRVSKMKDTRIPSKRFISVGCMDYEGPLTLRHVLSSESLNKKFVLQNSLSLNDKYTAKQYIFEFEL